MKTTPASRTLNSFCALCLALLIGPTVASFAHGQAPNDYSCDQSKHPSDAIGSSITGENSGVEIGLFDETTQSQVGKFTFVGGLWLFDGGTSAEVQEGTTVKSFSFGDYNSSNAADLKICASGKYFVLSSQGRRFRIFFPSLAFAAYVTEIK
jgi:hypothetical protein